MNRRPLPIDDVLPELVAALRQSSSVVLRAPTGAGKTTRTPPAVLDAGLAGERRIVMLEPRRLAARAAARRMAFERSCTIGDEVGFQVRFERQFGKRTRILVITEGVLLRMLHDDPFLDEIGVVIFDEFHERSLDNDLSLGMVRLLQQTVRPDLRMVVMSATLAVDAVSTYLGDCPIVTSAGRQFPVAIEYQPRSTHQPWPVAIAAAVEKMLLRQPGDLLVFLAGQHEIRQTAKQLDPLARQLGVSLVPLYGDLPAEQQDAALSSGRGRRVVLATNVAETSVTVEGITGVIDTGLARQMTFDSHVGIDRLQLVPISQSSADQRAGRAGRVGPGTCIRLWSANHHRARPEQTEPEIRRIDLTGAVLQLCVWGEPDAMRFPWFEPPRAAAVEQSLQLLKRLGAIDPSGLTDHGRALARLPVHPRLAQLLLDGNRRGVAEQAALAAALLSERDPFIRPPHLPSQKSPARTTGKSDVLDRVEALEEFEQNGRVDFPLGHLNRGAVRAVLQARNQLLRLVGRVDPKSLRRSPGTSGTDLKPVDLPVPHSLAVPSTADPFLAALLSAFPDRVAARRQQGSDRGLMVGGRGVRLAPWSCVSQAELFLCVDVDAGQSESIVRQASAIELRWLPADRLSVSVDVTWDPEHERVAARKRLRYEDLIVTESTAPLPQTEQTAEVLAAAALELFDRVKPVADSDAERYRVRVRSLRAWMPEWNLPAMDDEHLRSIVPTLCYGCRSFEDLRRANWLDALRYSLTQPQRQAVERDAPERMLVPSGSQIALQYEEGRPPVLAVRIQEIFGLRETPKVAGGRVRVLLHLLGPNYRPQQVTDDLPSFWANAYPEIRKELRRRYPKHSWPEDPTTATPERKPTRRK